MNREGARLPRAIVAPGKAFFYLPRYWLMNRVKSRAYGSALRNESRWVVLAFAWRRLCPLLAKIRQARAFEALIRQRNANLDRPLEALLDEVFLEVGKFFRVRAADDGERIEPSKFFKSTRASDEQFLKHWEQVASPTRKRMIAKYLLEIQRALNSFEG